MGPNDVFVIASNNKGKINEFKTLLSPAEIIPQSLIVQLEVDETGSTFFENALLKAKGVKLNSKKELLIYSYRVAGTVG